LYTVTVNLQKGGNQLLVLFMMKIGNSVNLRHASLLRPESIKSIDDSIQERSHWYFLSRILVEKPLLRPVG
jgi:hypothetical protein